MRADAHTGGHINDTWFVDTDRRRATCCSGSIRSCSPIRRRRGEYRARHCDVAAARAGIGAAVRCRARRRRGGPRRQRTYRMLGFVAGPQSRRTRIVAQASAAGVAFGRFQLALAHYDREQARGTDSAFSRTRVATGTIRPRTCRSPCPPSGATAANDIDKAQRDRARVIAESLGPARHDPRRRQSDESAVRRRRPRRARCWTSTP